MDFHTAHNILCEYTNEFYQLERGVLISESRKTFTFFDVVLGRRAIKHVIEQRKAEKLSPENMKSFFDRILNTISECDFEAINTNQSNYPMSIMRAKIFSESEIGMVIVLDKFDKTGRRAFITPFYCRPERIILMQKKKPQ